MTRVISLLVFLGLVVALFAVPSVEPGRLGAFQVGEILKAPEWRDPALDWQDVVRVHDQLTRADDETYTVAEVGAEDLTLTDADGNTSTVPLATLASEAIELEGRPLWRSLLEFTEEPEVEGGPRPILVTGALFQVSPRIEQRELDPKLHSDLKDSILRAMRSIGQEEGFEIDATVRLGDASVTTGVGLTATLRPGVRLGDELVVPAWEDRTGLSLELTHHGRDLTARAMKEDYRVSDPLVLLPPLVAIFLAILFRKPVLALLAGVFVGSFLWSWGRVPEVGHTVIEGSTRVVTYFLKEELVDNARIEIVLFVVFMLAMVGVITRAGGIRGLMDRIAGLASNARNTQLATWIMGLAIFFDDYANTILVGTTMRPLADKYRVAREKLAYIVDSTAAPVAGISVFSTWIAFEVSTFSAQLPDAGMAPSEGYALFFQTLPYRFYCILTLFFVGLIVFTGRDLGPMLRAERRARDGQVLAPGAKPLVSQAATELESDAGVVPAAWVAVVPLLGFILGTIGFILHGGGAFGGEVDVFSIRGFTNVLTNGSGGEPLMYGSAIGLGLAVVAALVVRLEPLKILTAAWHSLRAMGVALAILYLAWMVGRACADLGTADYLAVLLGDVNPLILPVALFGLSALVAFSTGSSWSTMTILLPLVVGLAFALGQSLAPIPMGMDAAQVGIDAKAYGAMLLVISIGAVLEGAIFGDHCSPISDTTVMSSIASASDHIDHVRTQMPYAMITMGVSMVCGYFPAVFFGTPDRPWLPFVCLGIGMLALVGIVRFYGRRADDPLDASAA